MPRTLLFRDSWLESTKEWSSIYIANPQPISRYTSRGTLQGIPHHEHLIMLWRCDAVLQCICIARRCLLTNCCTVTYLFFIVSWHSSDRSILRQFHDFHGRNKPQRFRTVLHLRIASKQGPASGGQEPKIKSDVSRRACPQVPVGGYPSKGTIYWAMAGCEVHWVNIATLWRWRWKLQTESISRVLKSCVTSIGIKSRFALDKSQLSQTGYTVQKMRRELSLWLE